MSNLRRTGFLCTMKSKLIVESADPFCKSRNISGLICGLLFKSHESMKTS